MHTIRTRRSVRTYTGQPLTDEHQQAIIDYLSDPSNMIGPHRTDVRILLRENTRQAGGRIGTYGFIKKAPAFLILLSQNTPDALLDSGYVMEKMMLHLNKLGLGTCWLGGTFQRKQFDAVTEDVDLIPAISPVGYPAKRPSLTERMIRTGAGADHRLPLDSLFYQDDFRHAITDEALRGRLHLVRLAPSASNKQPWRGVVKDSTLHLYLHRTPGYGDVLSYDIQWLDMGIAAAHYDYDHPVQYHVDDPHLEVPDEWTYVISAADPQS